MREPVTVAPPRVPLGLCLGITGHRNLNPQQSAQLSDQLGAVFTMMAAGVGRIRASRPRLFDGQAPVLTLLSPLAEGADQLAARAALDRAWIVDVVMPVGLEAYAAEMSPPAQTGLRDLLGRARLVRTLPDRQQGQGISDRAYELIGDATLAQADILIAAWDGQRARGPGGTADVVENAIRHGIPVIHLPTRSAGAPEMLWGGFDAMDVSHWHPEDVPRRPLADDIVDTVLSSLLLPPEDEALAIYFGERERRVRTRLEWPLLQIATGVLPLRSLSVLGRGYRQGTHEDWQAYRQSAAAIGGGDAGLERFEEAFAWADGLAIHYAQVYRSGMVFNFLGAALAVLLSLASFLLPMQKLPLLELELAVIAALIINTSLGTRQQWHRRWLDYRFLAEQLRPLKSLKLAAAAAPPLRKRAGEQRWTDWYAQGLWRATPLMPMIGNGDAARALGAHVAEHEIDDQVRYYASVAHRMHKLDHRLHQVGSVLLLMTIMSGSVMLVGLVAHVPAIKAILPLLAVTSAALPTIGAAIFGMRNAGDFAGVAGRSADTSRRLSAASSMLRRDGIDYATAARAVEETAAIMLADLAEWRSTYAYRKLAIPA